MRYALMTEPQQGLSYEQIRAVVSTAEESGFEAFFRSDHYASFPGDAGLPTTDAWATLAGLARDTSRITLGVLVSPVTFRVPGNFAKVVTTVAEMSGGRLEVGLGAGWNELEHQRHGILYPDTGVRFEMLEDHLAILHGLWTEPDGWSYEGRHWSLADARFYPKPPAPEGRRHPNIIVGGSGGPRMSALVARYADEMNISSAAPARVGEAYQRLDAACADDRSRPGGGDTVGDDRRARRRERGRRSRPDQRSSWSRSAVAAIPTRGSPSELGAGSSAHRIRLDHGSRSSRRPASSGSCCRPFCRATSTWFDCWRGIVVA